MVEGNHKRELIPFEGLRIAGRDLAEVKGARFFAVERVAKMAKSRVGVAGDKLTCVFIEVAALGEVVIRFDSVW